MSTITNSKTKKIVAGFVGLVSAVVMMGGAVVAPASAATVEELTAQINSLSQRSHRSRPSFLGSRAELARVRAHARTRSLRILQ